MGPAAHLQRAAELRFGGCQPALQLLTLLVGGRQRRACVGRGRRRAALVLLALRSQGSVVLLVHRRQRGRQLAQLLSGLALPRPRLARSRLPLRRLAARLSKLSLQSL